MAIEAVNLLAQEGIFVDTLITIGAPSRIDHALLTNVGQHLNVFNRRDGVQIIGGAEVRS